MRESLLVSQIERNSHRAATYLLQVMAVADNLFLSSAGVSQIFTALTIYHNDPGNSFLAFLYKFVHPLVHVTQLCTVWITVLVAFNRFIVVCLPFRAQMLCTIARVRIQTAILFTFIVIYNIPRFYEYDIQTVWSVKYNTTRYTGVATWLKTNSLYRLIYENILYCLFVFLGPLAILVVLQVKLIRELVQARRRLRERTMTSQSRNGSDDQEQNITLVMIVIVVVFLLCQTPAYVNQLLNYILDEDAYGCGRPYFYYFHVSNLIVSSNSAVNFVVYCAFRKQFRHRLRALCRGNLNWSVSYDEEGLASFGRLMPLYSSYRN